MPRAKKEEGATSPKKRSRTGCWPCKARKVKCGEEKPICINCSKSGETCDYSIRLNWAGRSKDPFVATPDTISSAKSSKHHEHVFSSQHIATARPSGTQSPEFQVAVSRAMPHAEQWNSSPSMDSQSLAPKMPTSIPLDWSPQPSAKRVRLSPTMQPNSMATATHQYDYTSPSSTYFTPPSIDSIVHTPTTSSSSIPSPMPPQSSINVMPPTQEAPDLRRLSVKSLLSDPTEDQDRPPVPRMDSHRSITYGYDHGLEDYDIPRNNDAAALRPRSPDLRRPSAAQSEISTSSVEMEARDIAFEPGGYYANPVAVKISKTLGELPSELTENAMNLLYFHHFINHTARIMVPHDCPDNPLRSVLPLMAVRNKQLLHLVLAFSASHRARLLSQPEPANRIAAWMEDVLPALRQALGRPSTPGSDDFTDLASLAPLVTAIMLASLEIVSPNTFAVPISWQDHLDVARRLIVSKGGLQRLALKSNGARDRAVFLISRWFAYLDVLGSLSGSKHRQPLGNAYLEDGGGAWLVNRSDDEIYRIDCFFGFSGRCIALLAAVAEVAAECDTQRLDSVNHREVQDWQPSNQTKLRAFELRERLIESAQYVYAGCIHTDGDDTSISRKPEKDKDEILATNEAFHWAGLIHLNRRVLGLDRSHIDVQESVTKVLDALQRVRQGSTAESCLLFPMFTAGCEAIDGQQQRVISDRMKSVEGWGMQHVSRARSLMQKAWETGYSWQVLVDGEFFG